MHRITILAGHNGSGKSLLAANLALALRRGADPDTPVIAVDMDTVKPYFRLTDARRVLTDAGVRLIAPELADSCVDLPTLPGELRAVFDTPRALSVLDVGGDDAGAIALGQYRAEFEKNGYELWLVANRHRYLTRDASEALTVLHEIEAASGLRATGIVSNPNLGPETTARTVEDAAEFANALSGASGLPVVATAYREDLSPDPSRLLGRPWPVRVFRKEEWVIFDA